MNTIVAPENFIFEQKRKEALAAEQVRAFQVLDPILRKLGYSLVCGECTRRFGYGKDGVQINAQPGDTLFRFTCNCSEKIFELKHRPGVKPS